MYKYTIENYRAIRRADIKIDGITVLAGINGSGKSTLSRWLYYLINSTHNFENYQRNFFIESLEREVDKIQRAFRMIPSKRGYNQIMSQLRRHKTYAEIDIDDLKGLYFSFVKKAEEDLIELAAEQQLQGRMSYYLIGKDTTEGTDDKTIIEKYLYECNETFEKGYEKYKNKTESYRIEDLEKVITSEYSEGERMPSQISLSEDGSPLLENDKFYPLLMLNRAIYIDSPMAVTDRAYSYGKDIWEAFQSYLYKENPQRKDIELEMLGKQIQTVIGGRIELTDDKFEIEKEIHFINKEQKFDININDAATGVKTFAYISQLLKNGWLDKETLLLIDEPEAHLHPQWIVEFARLLVMIRKELGVKIVLASHNPDMVAAIQSIAQKEGVIDETVFFLAEKEKEGVKFEFINKGQDIGDIFSSFNIALSRIEMYGSSVI